MELKRVISLDLTEASKVRKRQLAGTMTEYYDDEKYLCFDVDELETYKPKKSGRPPKRRE